MLSTLLLVALSKPWQAHYKTHYLVLTFGVGLSPATVVMCFMVDLAGVEPASRTLFSLLHTAITYIIYANELLGYSYAHINPENELIALHGYLFFLQIPAIPRLPPLLLPRFVRLVYRIVLQT